MVNTHIGSEAGCVIVNVGRLVYAIGISSVLGRVAIDALVATVLTIVIVYILVRYILRVAAVVAVCGGGVVVGEVVDVAEVILVINIVVASSIAIVVAGIVVVCVVAVVVVVTEVACVVFICVVPLRLVTIYDLVIVIALASWFPDMVIAIIPRRPVDIITGKSRRNPAQHFFRLGHFQINDFSRKGLRYFRTPVLGFYSAIVTRVVRKIAILIDLKLRVVQLRITRGAVVVVIRRDILVTVVHFIYIPIYRFMAPAAGGRIAKRPAATVAKNSVHFDFQFGGRVHRQ